MLSSSIFVPTHRVKPLLNLNRTPVVKSGCRFVTFGSCFAEEFYKLLHSIVSAKYVREVCRHFSSETLSQMLDGAVNGFGNIYMYEYDDYLGGINPVQFAVGRRFCCKTKLASSLQRMVGILRKSIEISDNFVFTAGTNVTLRMKDGMASINQSDKIASEAYYVHNASVEEVSSQIQSIYKSIRTIKGNDDFNFFITISPQRYGFVMDGESSVRSQRGDVFVQTCLSKSILRVAVDDFLENIDSNRCYYFPAFEIVTDELRSVELFIHDNMHVDLSLTPRYIMKRFCDQYFDDELIDAINRGHARAVEEYNAVSSKILHVGEAQFRGEKLRGFLDALASAIYRDVSHGNLYQHYIDNYRVHWGDDEIKYFIRMFLGKYSRVCLWGVPDDFGSLYSEVVSGLGVDKVLLVDKNLAGEKCFGVPVSSHEDVLQWHPDVIVVSGDRDDKELLDILGKLESCRII